MKKTVIVLAALTAMLSTVSCLKENGSETVKYTPMTFCAESKGMNTESSKAEMVYRYDLLWQENDEILVKNASERAVFKLVSEPGTTKGTFHCENSPFKAGDEVGGLLSAVNRQRNRSLLAGHPGQQPDRTDVLQEDTFGK